MITTLANARAWLNRNLFADAPLPSRIGGRPLLKGIAAAAALVAIQLARMWPSAPLNTVWAEDGSVYLPDARQHGLFHNLGGVHNGYLQVPSRLVAQLTAALPLSWFATATALAGAAIAAGCALLVWHASAAYIRAPYLRAALALLVVLVPVANVEMFDNVVNSIWFLMFAGFWLLLWRPARMATAAGAAAVLFLAILGNAGLILMFPLAGLRALAIRDRRDAVIVGAFGLGSVIQLAVLASQPPVVPARWSWSLMPAYSQRVIGGALSGDRITGWLWRQLGIPFEIALGAALIGFVLFALSRCDSPARVLVPLAVGISLLVYLVSGYQRDLGAVLPWPHGKSVAGGARYVVVPTLLLSSALFVLLDARPRLRSAAIFNMVRPAVAVLVLIAALFSFNASDSPIRGIPTWSAALSGARAVCAQIHPKVAQISIAPLEIFAVHLPCDQLN